MSASEVFPLSDEEVRLLQRGLLEWAGPARCTEEFAIGMGFSGVSDLLACGRRIRSLLDQRECLESIDWARSLLATEIAFASDVMGSGCEWATTTGLSDEVTIKKLRAIQRKLRAKVNDVSHDLGAWPS
jgi:hypothetical protein